jgi:hypothetical protein
MKPVRICNDNNNNNNNNNSFPRLYIYICCYKNVMANNKTITNVQKLTYKHAKEQKNKKQTKDKRQCNTIIINVLLIFICYKV